MHNYDMLPPHMRETAQLYIEYGAPPSSFLRAVLENNLAGAFAQADELNRARMCDWLRWLHNEIPSGCWGSRERVEAWITKHQEARDAARKAQHSGG